MREVKEVITCDWCKKQADKAVQIFAKPYDICPVCEEEMLSILQLSPEEAKAFDAKFDRSVKKTVEGFDDGMIGMVALPIHVPSDMIAPDDKPKKGRKKKEEVVEVKSLAAELDLDMRKRVDSDKLEKVLIEKPEATVEKIKAAVEIAPVYFQDCPEHKAILKQKLEERGLDFSKEDDRVTAFNIKINLMDSRVLMSDLDSWLDENLEAPF